VASKQLKGGIACHVEGSGPPLVLIHGGMGSWTHWARNIPVLREHFTVYAPDMPGHGDSIGVALDIPVDDYMAIVCAAIEEIAQGGRINLCGFSFGTSVASLVTARMPQTVERLALLAPAALGRLGPSKPMDQKRMPGDDAPEAAKREVLRHNLLTFMLAHPESIDEETIRIQSENAARTRFDSRRISMGTHTRDSLPFFKCPVMGIFGELDNFAWPSIWSKVVPCRSIKMDMRLEIVPQAGHWVQYEAAAAVNALLLDFFRS
jgi:pimeloyl-ACP methyl ester carboxylesterase